MTKLERMLHLVNLFKVSDKISLNELIAECRVSKRTIYRDLETLSKMNVPIRFENGYYLDGEISLPTFNFTDEEKELIGCSLKCSPLMRLPRFRDMIRDIERKILTTSESNNKESLNSYLHGELDETDVFVGEENIIIDCFIKNLESGEPLKLLLKNGESLVDLIPKSMSIRVDGWDLALYEQGDGKIYFISLSDISRMESVKMAQEMVADA